MAHDRGTVPTLVKCHSGAVLMGVCEDGDGICGKCHVSLSCYRRTPKRATPEYDMATADSERIAAYLA